MCHLTRDISEEAIKYWQGEIGSENQGNVFSRCGVERLLHYS